MSNEIMLWEGPKANSLPSTATLPREFIPYAIGLKKNEQLKVMSAFEQGLFDLATDFVWRRSLSQLKQTLASLGMQFIGEMLGRDDINELSLPENVLTDWDAIRLAENLGVINYTGVLRLKHGFELLSHFARPQTEDELEQQEACSIIRNCVRYILAETDFGIAINFSRFRERLTSETIGQDDLQLHTIFTSSPFFLRTALRVLLNAIKTENGAKLEHALNNFGLTLPQIWKNISEEDRWVVGTTYAEVANDGKNNLVAAIRRVLLTVSGFDYVPENLRSNSFRHAATAVINAHFSFNNFALEEQPTRILSRLGTVIPAPALIDCMRAYLCVYLGNSYGYSFDASPIAERELKAISPRYWNYYLDKALISDDTILSKLTSKNPALRFSLLLKSLDFIFDLETKNTTLKKLINSALSDRINGITSSAETLSLRHRGVNPTVSV